MKVYYTGANEGQTPQTSPNKSLGGYVSTSIIPNGSLSNLFDSISQYALMNGSRECRAIVLTNDEAQAKNITLHYNILSNDPISFFKMALVALATDDCGKKYMERIASSNAQPVNAFFLDNRGENNALTFSLGVGESIGVWIQRTINKSKGIKYLSNDELENRFNAVDKFQQGEIELTSNVVDKTYWTIDLQDSKAYIYYTTNSVDTIIEDRELIKVNITQGMSVEQIVTATVDRLKEVLEFRDEATVEKLTASTFKITHNNPGKHSPISDETAPIVILETLGQSKEVEQVESIEMVFDITNQIGQ